VSSVYKFGGSSVRDAERMREVAAIACGFPEEAPCVVLSAMGKTTNNLLAAGRAAAECAGEAIKDPQELPAVAAVLELHRATMDELGTDAEARQEVEDLLDQFQQVVCSVAILGDLSPRVQDTLVSFGERMSTRIFAAFLRSQGVRARQHDAWKLGMVTSDEFSNGEVQYDETLPGIREGLMLEAGAPLEIPVVTGFLGRGGKTGAITTLGRGGSDLTATVIGAALGVPEVQVWKDVDGVLSADPRIVPEAGPVGHLTYDEATELAFFGATVLHPQSMRPAMLVDGLDIRVKNSYNREAPGTLISRERHGEDSLLTSIVLKRDVTVLDIQSTRMLGQYGFMAKLFDAFEEERISVDLVATSEVSVSVTLDPGVFWSRDLADDELESLRHAVRKVARVEVNREKAIISLVGNVRHSSSILEKAFRALGEVGANVEMISQGASKNNISLVVPMAVAVECVQALHNEFFGNSSANMVPPA
jgi:aspartate kinase